MNKNQRLRLLSYFVIIYMLVAFSWWSVLLFSKNRDAFEAKVELQRIGMVAEGLYHNENQFLKSKQYLGLKKKYKRQEWMITGEISALVLSLVLGTWLINRAYYRELKAGLDQRNFLLSITHELNSPLSGLRLFLDTLLKRDLQREKLVEIGKNATRDLERLQNQVDHLLLAAKLESQYEPVFEQTDIGFALKDIAQQYRDRFAQHYFQIDLSNGMDCMIEADRNDISTIIGNLLENAVKYSGENNEIEIRGYSTENSYFIEISDSGIGVPEHERAQVFTKFYRIDNKNGSSRGTGLGLYIVKKMVELHGGSVHIKDHIPRGTTFIVKLPIKRYK